MNTCVSDDENIVNIQGIRYVSWGESNESNYRHPNCKYIVMVTYKGNHVSFYYTTYQKAKAMFTKIREAMDKSLAKEKAIIADPMGDG